MTKHNWRYNLDPRDPDYMDPPTEEEVAEQEDTEIFYSEERVHDYQD